MSDVIDISLNMRGALVNAVTALHPDAEPKDIGLALAAAVGTLVSYRRIPWFLQQIQRAADEKERIYIEEHGLPSPPHSTHRHISDSSDAC